MDLTFNHADVAIGAVVAPDVAPAVGAPEWTSLVARFRAAHALRRELSAADSGVAAGGGFLAEGAAVLASNRRESGSVNLTVLGNCKAEAVITMAIAGNPYPASEE